MSLDSGFDPRLSDRVLVERLADYLTLLRRWNKSINLISPTTLETAWSRHVEDSLALLDHAPPCGEWIDVGSGGGFPGMVLAIAGASAIRMRLIESDRRKCEFLRAVSRELQLDVVVENQRADLCRPLEADVVTARAVTSLSGLLGCVVTTRSSSPVGLFPKGATWEREVDEARRRWDFDVDPIASRTAPGAAILRVRNVTPR